MGRPIRVLIVDDSLLARKIIKKSLSLAHDIDVVGESADAFLARAAIKKLKPDLLTLDIEMPGMDGLIFLENLMRLQPIPIVMVSSLTEVGGGATLEALSLGAVDFVLKPKSSDFTVMQSFSYNLIQKIRAAHRIPEHVLLDRQRKLIKGVPLSQVSEYPLPSASNTGLLERCAGLLVAIGASTGGPEALKTFITALPADFPAVVVTIHIPAGFSLSLAKRLNSLSQISVKEAVDGEQVLPGVVYIAPGNFHVEIVKRGFNHYIRTHQGARYNRHRPSVDVLFKSIVQAYAPQNVLGILMTGMGRDGAQGLLEMHRVGMTTYAQDEASSVVWGMPGEAVKLGAESEIYPLEKLAPASLRWLSEAMAEEPEQGEEKITGNKP